MRWNEKYITTDAEIGLVPLGREQAAQDLQVMFNLATFEGLKRLYRMARAGKLVRYAYEGPDGSGCLMNGLFGIHSKDELLKFGFESDAEGLAARRIVRSFDYRWIGDQT